MIFKQIRSILNKEKTKTLANKKYLNTVITISAFIMLFLHLLRISDFFINPNNKGLPLIYTLLLFLFFVFLLILSRWGYQKTSSWLLIISYALPTIYRFGCWGSDLPAAILMTVLITMLAGIFLGSKEATIVATTFATLIIFITYLQTHNFLSIDNSWRQEPMQMADAIAYVLILSIIFVLAWIIVRENRRALKIAEERRQKLIEAKDQLEIKVEERTKEIKRIQKEKLEQLQTLASIGQLSSSIFHDIVNPLTVVGLNLEQMKEDSCPELEINQSYIHQALSATDKISELIGSVNNCLRHKNQEKYFSVQQEIEKIKKIMESKAKTHNIEMQLEINQDAQIKGGPTRFGQIIMNLISNAIDAEILANKAEKKIKITLNRQSSPDKVKIYVQDNGAGISSENTKKIFDLFFTTKSENSKNIGVGLSMIKEIIEIDFKGNIEVESQLNIGSTFIVTLPIC